LGPAGQSSVSLESMRNNRCNCCNRSNRHNRGIRVNRCTCASRQRLRSYQDRIFAPIDHFYGPMPMAGERPRRSGEIATDISNREFDIGPAEGSRGDSQHLRLNLDQMTGGGSLSAPKRKPPCPQNIRGNRCNHCSHCNHCNRCNRCTRCNYCNHCNHCDWHTRTERSERVSTRRGRLRGRSSRAVGSEVGLRTWLERGRLAPHSPARAAQKKPWRSAFVRSNNGIAKLTRELR
jgi:hypothetical protein